MESQNFKNDVEKSVFGQLGLVDRIESLRNIGLKVTWYDFNVVITDPRGVSYGYDEPRDLQIFMDGISIAVVGVRETAKKKLDIDIFKD